MTEKEKLGINADERFIYRTIVKYLNNFSKGFSQKELYHGLQTDRKKKIDERKFETEFLHHGRYTLQHHIFVERLNKQVQNSKTQLPSWIHALNDQLQSGSDKYSRNARLTAKILKNMFPYAGHDSSHVQMQNFQREHSGIYRFARFRYQPPLESARKLLQDTGKLIIAGICVVHAHEHGSRFLRFDNWVPAKNYNASKFTNRGRGIVLPKEQSIYYVGDERDGQYPLMVALQRSLAPGERNHLGVLSRKQFQGGLISTKILFRKMLAINSNTSRGELYREIKNIRNQDPFLTCEEFSRQFKCEISDILNLGENSGRGPLQI